MWLVGGYTPDMDGSASGILALSTRDDGSLEVDRLVASAASPSYLAASADLLFAVAEGTGELVTFSRSFEPLAVVSAGGDAPCHIGVYGSTVVVANYVSGTLGVVSTDPFALTQVVEGDGSGPHHVQDGPHAHSTLHLADGRILSADLGADRLHVHSLEDGRLARITSVELPAGTGPRDIVQLPSGDLLVLAELTLEVLVLSPALEILATVSIPGATAGDHAAGLSLRGDHVYTALRGSNRIGVLEFVDGSLTAIDFVSSEGDWPRHHAIDGDVLHVANQLTSTVASFSLTDGGIPRLIAPPTAVPSPTFLLRF
jgi:6-phosphogluconolactonase